MNLHLIQIKRSNKRPKAGDIFVVQPMEGIYYYGKVIYEKTYRIFNNEYAKGRWDRAGNIYNSK